MSAAILTPHPSVGVLVVEDDLLIRLMAVEALVDAGFAVIEAQHADDAVNILATRAYQVRALFTDIHMSGSMNGLELANFVHGRWPSIALLIASGQAKPVYSDMPEGARFLSKPYDLGYVVSQLRELVGAE
jgi:DNA-binding NtrC family response regulator